MSVIEVEELFEFSAVGAAEPRAVGFCEDGTVLVANVIETVQKRVPRKGSKGSTIERLFRYRVTAWRDGAVWQSELTEPIGAVDFVQAWQDKLLLVGSWCEDRRSGPVPNAHLVEWDGSLVASWVFGLGVNDVRASRERVWCGYIDQAVFNYDTWGPDREAMAQWGVRAFDRNGVAQPLGGALAGTEIADVYALNVCADDDLWIYAYTRFDLLRLRRGTVSVFSTDVRGARAVCVDRSRALIVGDYEQSRRAVEIALDERGGSIERALEIPWEVRDRRALRTRGHRDVLWLWDEQRVGRASEW